MNQHPTEEQIVDYLHGELAPGADAALLLHLEDCAQCRSDYGAQARISELLRDYAVASERDFPLGMSERIRNAIESVPGPSWDQRVRALLRPVMVIPVAAAFAIAAFLGHGVTLRHGATTIIDAAYYLDDHAALTSTVPFGEGTVVPSTLYTGQSASDQQWLASSGASDVAADGAEH